MLPKRRWRAAAAGAPGLIALLLVAAVAGLTIAFPVSITI
jgi:hypothetical protein